MMSNNVASCLSAEDILSQLCLDEETGDQSSYNSFLDTDDDSKDEYKPEGDFVDMNGIQLLIDPSLLANSNLSQQVVLLPSE